MTQLKDHPSSERIKLLLGGVPGSGKTSLLATVANAGFNPRIIDMDGKLSIMLSYINPDSLNNVIYQSINARSGSAFPKAEGLTNYWKVGEENLGRPKKDWTPKDVLCIDTGSLLGEACMRHALSINGKSPDDVKHDMSIYGIAQNLFLNLIAELTSEAMPFSFIMTTHLKFIEGEKGIEDVRPDLRMGKALDPFIARHFTDYWKVDINKKGERFIRTQPDQYTKLFCSAPEAIPEDASMDLGALLNKILAAKAKSQTGAKP